jgi:surfactin synthase thioesterase subunit
MNTGNGLHEEWVRRFHPSGEARARLVCLPHAGGSASFYFPLSKALAPEWDVLAVQYPGRQDRRHEPCIDNIPELADAVAGVLAPWLDRPVALFGHSMGATLAFEVASRLERDGVVPLAVFVSGRRAPSRSRVETAHRNDDDGLIAEVRSLAGTDSRIFADEDILRMALPAIRNDYRAAETYRYTGAAPLRAPIHAHVGTEDPKVTLAEARAWADHTTGEFSLRTYPGGHFYLIDHAATVTRGIAETLSAIAV